MIDDSFFWRTLDNLFCPFAWLIGWAMLAALWVGIGALISLPLMVPAVALGACWGCQ